ncbi:hypothetical protein [Microbacterium laevaniformans]|uniref:hypothetical protein n=1 Tax=Microbacterium laevaniformans TaxID=36807 RepID=UPI003D95C10B
MTDLLADLHALQEHIDAMPAARATLIGQAREAGHTWVEIGAALGMSHVAAMKAAKPNPKPRSGATQG